jgi:hypothetical protein
MKNGVLVTMDRWINNLKMTVKTKCCRMDETKTTKCFELLILNGLDDVNALDS